MISDYLKYGHMTILHKDRVLYIRNLNLFPIYQHRGDRLWPPDKNQDSPRLRLQYYIYKKIADRAYIFIFCAFKDSGDDFSCQQLRCYLGDVPVAFAAASACSTSNSCVEAPVVFLSDKTAALWLRCVNLIVFSHANFAAFSVCS